MTRPGSGSAVLPAASEWEAAVVEAEQRQDWAEADQARLRWALCLHRQGQCDEAVMVPCQAWREVCIGQREGLAAAAILCVRLLRRCRREDEAGELWELIQTHTTARMRRKALNYLLSPANSDLHEIVDRRHHQICANGRRAKS